MASTSALIIDNGSYEIKAGLASAKKPQIVFPSIVAIDQSDEVKSVLVGKEAVKKVKSKSKDNNSFGLRYPIQRGMAMDWEQIEHMWRYCFKGLELETPPPTLLTCQPDMPFIHKQSMLEIFFELFDAPKVAIEVPGFLAFKAQKAVDTALVCDIGSGVTTVTPVVGGHAIYHAITKMPFSGQDITRNIVQLLSRNGYIFDAKEETKVAQHIKQNMAYVAQDYRDELKAVRENPKQFVQELELPSGDSLKLTRECFQCAEILFDPSIVVPSSNAEGLQGLPLTCINAAVGAALGNMDTEKQLYRNLLVTGGSSQIPGIGERLEKDVKSIVKKKGVKKASAQVLSPHATWIGGAVHAKSSNINWITKKEYQEQGSEEILKKKVKF